MGKRVLFLGPYFNGFPFVIQDSPTAPGIDPAFRLGGFTLPELAKLYWRVRKVSVAVPGSMTIAHTYGGVGGGPELLVTGTIPSPVTLDRGEDEEMRAKPDAADFPAGGSRDSVEGTFVCEAYDPPQDVEYGGSVETSVQFELFSLGVRKFEGLYYPSMLASASLLGTYGGGGLCGGSASFGAGLNIPTDPSGVSGVSVDASIFGRSVVMDKTDSGDFFGDNTYSGLTSFVVSIAEYYPFAKADGSPAYDTATGEPV